MPENFFAPLPQQDPLDEDRLSQFLQRQTISAQKIRTGSLQAEQTVSSSNFSSGSAGWQIDGNGDAEFNSVTVRGEIITGGATIGATGTLESSNFSAGSAGWKIDGDGSAELNNVTVRGEIITGGATIGSTGTLESSNFSSGSAGWQIDGDGSAEFNDVTIRGDLAGNWNGADPADLSTSPDSTASTGFYFDSSVGRFQLTDFAYANEWRVYNPGTTDTPGGLREISGRPQLVAYNGNDLELSTAIGGNILLNPGTGSQVHLSDDGSDTIPALAFTNDQDTGIYRPAANQLGLTVGGSEGFRLQGASIFSLFIKDDTTATAGNVHIDSTGGRMRRSTSSLAYKPDWRFINPVDVRLPDPISWTDENGQVRIGFGAEHVHEAVPEAYEDEHYDYRALIAVLWAHVKRLEDRPWIRFTRWLRMRLA